MTKITSINANSEMKDSIGAKNRKRIISRKNIRRASRGNLSGGHQRLGMQTERSGKMLLKIDHRVHARRCEGHGGMAAIIIISNQWRKWNQ
jgi:hypothetical protein